MLKPNSIMQLLSFLKCYEYVIFFNKNINFHINYITSFFLFPPPYLSRGNFMNYFVKRMCFCFAFSLICVFFLYLLNFLYFSIRLCILVVIRMLEFIGAKLKMNLVRQEVVMQHCKLLVSFPTFTIYIYIFVISLNIFIFFLLKSPQKLHTTFL